MVTDRGGSAGASAQRRTSIATFPIDAVLYLLFSPACVVIGLWAVPLLNTHLVARPFSVILYGSLQLLALSATTRLKHDFRPALILHVAMIAAYVLFALAINIFLPQWRGSLLWAFWGMLLGLALAWVLVVFFAIRQWRAS